MVEKPTKDDLLKKCEGIDQIIKGRFNAKPDQVEKDNLLEIRKEVQELTNMVLSM